MLTEEENFQGALAHLRDARAAVGLPVLRKDFILDSYQVWEARAANADSFLLIAAALDDAGLADLLAWDATWAWKRWLKCTPPRNCDER